MQFSLSSIGSRISKGLKTAAEGTLRFVAEIEEGPGASKTLFNQEQKTELKGTANEVPTVPDTNGVVPILRDDDDRPVWPKDFWDKPKNTSEDTGNIPQDTGISIEQPNDNGIEL